jgi:hypothetical protein
MMNRITKGFALVKVKRYFIQAEGNMTNEKGEMDYCGCCGFVCIKYCCCPVCIIMGLVAMYIGVLNRNTDEGRLSNESIKDQHTNPHFDLACSTPQEASSYRARKQCYELCENNSVGKTKK